MIRNVVIHLLSEQPMIADLFDMPSTADVTLRLTNLRTLDRKRPVFVDHSESIFFFPYLHVRFIEIPQAEISPSGDESGGQLVTIAASNGSGPHDDADLEIEIDEDFLRRVREA